MRNGGVSAGFDPQTFDTPLPLASWTGSASHFCHITQRPHQTGAAEPLPSNEFLTFDLLSACSAGCLCLGLGCVAPLLHTACIEPCAKQLQVLQLVRSALLQWHAVVNLMVHADDAASCAGVLVTLHHLAAGCHPCITTDAGCCACLGLQRGQSRCSDGCQPVWQSLQLHWFPNQPTIGLRFRAGGCRSHLYG